MTTISIEKISHGYVGVSPSDAASIAGALGESCGMSILQETPLMKVILCPFRVSVEPVTKKEFLNFYFSSAAYRDPKSVHFWERVAGIDQYDDDFPIVGASLLEAQAYAFSRGGRLLHEYEYEYLIRKGRRSGFFSSQSIRVSEPRSFLETVGDLANPASLQVSNPFGLKGLVGVTRELVWGNMLPRTRFAQSDHWACVIKPFGAKDFLHHAGVRIVQSNLYIEGTDTRGFNVEPASFRVAFD